MAKSSFKKAFVFVNLLFVCSCSNSGLLSYNKKSDVEIDTLSSFLVEDGVYDIFQEVYGKTLLEVSSYDELRSELKTNEIFNNHSFLTLNPEMLVVSHSFFPFPGVYKLYYEESDDLCEPFSFLEMFAMHDSSVSPAIPPKDSDALTIKFMCAFYPTEKPESELKYDLAYVKSSRVLRITLFNSLSNIVGKVYAEMHWCDSANYVLEYLNRNLIYI